MYKNPKTYKNTPVVTSDWLITFLSSERSRGMALGWVILVRQPDQLGWVHSTTGKKHIDALLRHEYKHIEEQRRIGRIKWFYKYLTNKSFREYQEKIAREAE
jgi:hypothetical protein